MVSFVGLLLHLVEFGGLNGRLRRQLLEGTDRVALHEAAHAALLILAQLTEGLLRRALTGVLVHAGRHHAHHGHHARVVASKFVAFAAGLSDAILQPRNLLVADLVAMVVLAEVEVI